MDTRTSQQTRDPSRGGHAGSAARADESGSMIDATVPGVVVNALLKRIDFGLSVSR